MIIINQDRLIFLLATESYSEREVKGSKHIMLYSQHIWKIPKQNISMPETAQKSRCIVQQLQQMLDDLHPFICSQKRKVQLLTFLGASFSRA